MSGKIPMNRIAYVSFLSSALRLPIIMHLRKEKKNHLKIADIPLITGNLPFVFESTGEQWFNKGDRVGLHSTFKRLALPWPFHGDSPMPLTLSSLFCFLFFRVNSVKCHFFKASIEAELAQSFRFDALIKVLKKKERRRKDTEDRCCFGDRHCKILLRMR